MGAFSLIVVINLLNSSVMEHREEPEVTQGPSVESADPEERIMARRLRIKKRLEQQRKAALGESDIDSKAAKQELSKSRKQMKDSKDRVDKLKKRWIQFSR